MRSSIKSILLDHRILDPKLLEDLNQLFEECMRASKSFGQKLGGVNTLSAMQEDMVWEDIERSMKRLVKEPNEPFNQAGVARIKQDYGVYKRK